MSIVMVMLECPRRSWTIFGWMLGLFLDLRTITLLKERGRIAWDRLPTLRLIQRGEKNPVHMMDGPGRSSTLVVASTSCERSRIGLADLDRL